MFSNITGVAQIIYYDDQPAGYETLKSSIKWFNPVITKAEISAAKMVSADKNQPLTFAIGRKVSLTPDNSGYIVDLPDSKKIWHLFIRSENAKSINIIFSKFNLKENEKVFIYNRNMSDIQGPFTYRNNKQPGSLATVPVQGSEIVIEYHFSEKDRGLLEVGQISHDFLGVFGSNGSKDQYYGTSGSCNIDINCSQGDNWQEEKRAVVRVLANGTELGTGFMVNNIRQENIPYLISAQHVIPYEQYATNSVYIFGYESPWCDGPDGRITYSLSGASLISTNEEIDFTLVKLSEFPPILYKPYLLGWDASGTLPQHQVTIHHPSGDVKKISVDDDPPIISTFPDKYENGFWKILQWDYGTTEAGSSGSPLFNQDHRVIGLLTGGEASCGNSVNDYFARFDIAFDISDNSSESLKPWLDQDVTGLLSVEGRDPFYTNFLNSDTLNNFAEDEMFLTMYDLPQTGYTTGYNSDSIISYAEKFFTLKDVEITDIYLYVGSSTLLTSSDSVSIYIMSDNGGPDQVIDSETVFLQEVKDTFNLRVDFREPVSVVGDFYISYRVWYGADALSEPRQFAIFHSGTIPVENNSAFFLDNYGWHPFTDHPYDPAPRHLKISVVTVVSSIVNSLKDMAIELNHFLVYPNPFGNFIRIKRDSPLDDNSSIELIDINGRVLKNSYLQKGISQFDLQGLEEFGKGIYLVVIRTGNNIEVHRVIKGGY
ncbi:MAG: T9SS type A sorting domain-containing protein [Bacteroidales bacterium]|nr:T9SS type A sorting domain-containing protein [Bacteroidales bacterium]